MFVQCGHDVKTKTLMSSRYGCEGDCGKRPKKGPMLFLGDFSKDFPHSSFPKSDTFSNLFMGENYNLHFWIILHYTLMSLIRVLARFKPFLLSI